MRLDAALAFIFSHMGIRGRRRLWQEHAITVNGRPQAAGFMVYEGDTIAVIRIAGEIPESDATPTTNKAGSTHVENEIRIVNLNADFVALYKPAGVHTAHIAGSLRVSLEALLPRIWQELYAHWKQSQSVAPQGDIPPVPRLLTRLDLPTSGLVMSAFSTEATEQFRHWEAIGAVQKKYFAIAQGTLEQPLVLKEQLYTRNTDKTTVLPAPDADPTRHTRVTPLQTLAKCHAQCETKAPCTLLLVEIQRGARHQIRAHLAHAGFPITGDTLYSNACSAAAPENFDSEHESASICTKPTATNATFFLHHAAVDMPGFSANCPAPLDVSVPNEFHAMLTK